MQKDNGQSPNPPYLFARVTSEALDTLSVQTRGPPAKPQHRAGTTSNEEVWGLTRSLFRPSDDAVTLPYNIPGSLLLFFPFICCSSALYNLCPTCELIFCTEQSLHDVTYHYIFTIALVCILQAMPWLAWS